jgi:hypothetical protein
MGFKPGETVIVTQEGTNRVGVVLDKFQVHKKTMYDVLLESRSAISMLTTSNNNKTFINKQLTKSLCESNTIQTTIPYHDLLVTNLLPDTKS